MNGYKPGKEIRLKGLRSGCAGGKTCKDCLGEIENGRIFINIEAEADDDDEVEVMVMVGGEHVTSCHVHKDEIEYVNVDWRLRLK